MSVPPSCGTGILACNEGEYSPGSKVGSEGGEMSEGKDNETCKYEKDIITNIYAPDKHERRRCPRPVYGNTDYCIYHAPIETKRDLDFPSEIRYLYEKTVEKYKDPELQRDGTVFFDCQGFKFPEGSFNKLPQVIDIPILIGDAEIEGDVDWKNVEFREPVVFNGVVFKGQTDFEKAHFHEYVVFQQCRFSDLDGPSCWFLNTVFDRGVIFRMCKFEGETDFMETRFLGRTSFTNIEARKSLNLYLCIFAEEALFHRICAEFEDYGYLNGFVPVIDPCAIVDFQKVYCKKPKALFFDSINLSRWAFAQTRAIGDAYFLNVTWKPSPKARKQTRDEELLEDGEITYEDCAEVYRLIRFNYEARLAYEQASDFHLGQMETMLKSLGNNIPKKWFLWLYKYVSNFGESVGRPLLWFGGLWLFFAGVWFFKGFRYDGGSVNFDLTWPWLMSPDLEIAKDIGQSLLYSFKTFLTLPDLKGGIVSQTIGAVQRLAGASVITLFILALRRAFRR